MDCPLSGGTIREETLFSAGDEIRSISRPKHKVDCIDAKLRVKFNPGNFCRKLWCGRLPYFLPPPSWPPFFRRMKRWGKHYRGSEEKGREDGQECISVVEGAKGEGEGEEEQMLRASVDIRFY